ANIVRKGFLPPEDTQVAYQHAPAHQPDPRPVLMAFLGHLGRHLTETTNDMLWYMWAPYMSGCTARTAFYYERPFPRISRSWTQPLVLAPEYRIFDYAFLDPSIGQPLILAELENDCDGINASELPKLSRAGAPPSVITTCMEWHGHPNIGTKRKMGQK